jgi:hypothetical protein
MIEIPKYVTAEFLRENPDVIFVFGDNLIRKGKGGAAVLRDEPNTYGFITKKYPNNQDSSFYRPDEYVELFYAELLKLAKEIEKNPERTYLISKLGGGLANKYKIYEEIIKPGLGKLALLDNVIIM